MIWMVDGDGVLKPCGTNTTQPNEISDDLVRAIYEIHCNTPPIWQNHYEVLGKISKILQMLPRFYREAGEIYINMLLSSNTNIWNFPFLTDRHQGWTGNLFFSRGGAGRGRAWPKIYGAGQRGEPPLPHSAGRGGEGVKIYGAGNILRVSADWNHAAAK